MLGRINEYKNHNKQNTKMDIFGLFQSSGFNASSSHCSSHLLDLFGLFLCLFFLFFHFSVWMLMLVVVVLFFVFLPDHVHVPTCKLFVKRLFNITTNNKQRQKHNIYAKITYTTNNKQQRTNKPQHHIVISRFRSRNKDHM